MQTIGPYHVVRELGRGGMGVVYEVAHPELPGRRLALKQNLSDEPETTVRFLREAQLLARVEHPNVVRVVALDRAPSGPYLVTDLVEGRELTELGPLGTEPREAARLVRELADAVEAVHAQGILHRDIKPQNVIVTPDGRPVLLDFGVAREVGGERLTQTGAAVGTAQYMSPEQASGEPTNQLTARTDVYALGVLLYYLLSGGPPFHGTGLAVITRVLTEEPPWPPDVPPDLDAILRRAMAKERIERYPSAAALRDDLDRFLAGAPVEAAPVRRRRWPALAGLVVLAAGLAVAVGVRARGVEPDPTPSGSSAAASPRPTASEPTEAPSDPGPRVLELLPGVPLPSKVRLIRFDGVFASNDQLLLWTGAPLYVPKDTTNAPWQGVFERWRLKPRVERVKQWKVPLGATSLRGLLRLPDGSLLLAVADRLLRLAPEGAPEPVGPPFPGVIQALARAPEGAIAIGLLHDGQPVWTWDPRRPEPPRPLELPERLRYQLATLCYLPDGSLVLGTAEQKETAGTRGEVLWLREPPLYRPMAAQVRSLAPDPPGSAGFWVGTAAPQVLRIDRAGRQRVVEMPAEEDTNRSFKIRRSLAGPARGIRSRDGKLFALSGSAYPAGNELRVWLAKDDGFRHLGVVKPWPKTWLTSLDMSPDGTRLLIGTQTRFELPRVQVWPVSFLLREGLQPADGFPRRVVR